MGWVGSVDRVDIEVRQEVWGLAEAGMEEQTVSASRNGVVDQITCPSSSMRYIWRLA